MKMSFYIKEVTPCLPRQHAGWPLKWRLRMGTRGSRQMESLSACARSNKLLISFPKKQRDDLNLERKAPAGRFLFAWWSWSCMSFTSTFIAFGGGGVWNPGYDKSDPQIAWIIIVPVCMGVPRRQWWAEIKGRKRRSLEKYCGQCDLY